MLGYGSRKKDHGTSVGKILTPYSARVMERSQSALEIDKISLYTQGFRSYSYALFQTRTIAIE